LDLAYRDDNSLGFDTFNTPEEGYPVYNERGIFFNEISMNKSGLRGKGILTYLGSTIESENILFLPNRAVIQVDDVVVEKNSSAFGNPEILGNNLVATWDLDQNALNFDNEDEPLTLYGNGEFKGKISIQSESVHANGTLIMDEFTAISEDFTLMEEQFEMNDGQLKIHTKFSRENGNYPLDEDLDQSDLDEDGVGDVCDDSDDGGGISPRIAPAPVSQPLGLRIVMC